jgi:hypothetical protein
MDSNGSFTGCQAGVGFVYGAADLNPHDAAEIEGYAETRFIKRAQGKRYSLRPQGGGLWDCGGSLEVGELVVAWSALGHLKGSVVRATRQAHRKH